MSSAPFSEVLGTLARHDENAIPLKKVIAAVGARIHGSALLLLSLPDAVPLPIPSVSAILGLPLLMIAAHLALFGERSRLPARVENVSIPRRTFQILERYLSPVLRRLEHVSRPRWPALAQRERLVGAVCAYLAIILLMPLPLMNTPPAMALALISWGLIQKDGAVIAFGMAGAALLTVALVFLALWLFGGEFSLAYDLRSSRIA